MDLLRTLLDPDAWGVTQPSDATPILPSLRASTYTARTADGLGQLYGLETAQIEISPPKQSPEAFRAIIKDARRDHPILRLPRSCDTQADCNVAVVEEDERVGVYSGSAQTVDAAIGSWKLRPRGSTPLAMRRVENGRSDSFEIRPRTSVKCANPAQGSRLVLCLHEMPSPSIYCKSSPMLPVPYTPTYQPTTPEWHTYVQSGPAPASRPLPEHWDVAVNDTDAGSVASNALRVGYGLFSAIPSPNAHEGSDQGRTAQYAAVYIPYHDSPSFLRPQSFIQTPEQRSLTQYSRPASPNFSPSFGHSPGFYSTIVNSVRREDPVFDVTFLNHGRMSSPYGDLVYNYSTAFLQQDDTAHRSLLGEFSQPEKASAQTEGDNWHRTELDRQMEYILRQSS
ncbi:unnamed protein product [Peniophora sp. CBMAI 1063]|nr:unnamed protein product [Peniophora sp. CBMAI 1063]